MSRRTRNEFPVEQSLTDGQIRWADRVAQHVAGMLPPSFDLEDLQQVARIETWRKLQVFDAARGVSFTSFAFKGVRGACLMFARRRNYTAATSLPLDSQPESGRRDQTEANLHNQHVRKLLGQVLDELLDERERRVLILQFIKGYDVAAIAAELSCSASLVRLIRQQAYASMRQRLALRGITASEIGWQ